MSGMIADKVREYVQTRDKRRELKRLYTAEDEPLAAKETELGGLLLAHLHETGANSVNTPAGTCYKSERASASLGDPDAFMRFVTTNALFELLDRRANVTAVKDYIEKNNTPPPGVNYYVMETLGVQRASNREA